MPDKIFGVPHTEVLEVVDPKRIRLTKARRKARRAFLIRQHRLVGKRFGLLTVLRRYAGSLWECRCDCGNEVMVFGNNLTSGNTKSCGYAHRPISKRKFRAKQWSPEHRAKLSKAAREMSDDRRKQLSEAARNKKMTPEQRSEAVRKGWATRKNKNNYSDTSL